METESNTLLPITTTQLDQIDFFSKEVCGDPLYINCNFVFLTRDDGSGAFPEGSPFTNALIEETVSKMNDRWGSVRDHNDCASDEGYSFDSNVRVKVGTHYIANTEAWDYYAQAASLTSYNVGTFCPNSIMLSDTWPALKSVINEFNTAHQDAINFFFVENGAHIKYIEELVEEGLEPSGAWDEQFDIFRGCSRLPQAYNETNENSKDQFIIMVGHYTDWLAKINFGTIYSPQYADEGNEVLAQWHLNNMPITANHELGHSIIAWPTVHNNDGCDNLMSSPYSTSKRYLSLGQLSQLHKTLMTTNNHNYVSCQDLTENTCNLEITQDAMIDMPISIYGDIIISNGVTLTITSDVFLSKESSIILEENAKLIVDGGLLTNGCSETWLGIEVVGGNTDFDVKLINSTIENTSKPAVSMMPPLPWPEKTLYGNGILHAENTVFNNTRRLAEFIAFQPSPNPSYIRDCTQNGGGWGITNWNCLFVNVQDNIFNDIGSHCIVNSSGSFVIENNKFHGAQNDILYVQPSSGISSTIRNNEFYGQNTGIREIGTTMDQDLIEYNHFYSGTNSVWMEGDNYYDIRKNTFNASTQGVVSMNNGNHPNEVALNAFNSNSWGIIPHGINSDYVFFRNCFNTLSTDAFINGTIATFINDSSKPANNCFTHQGNINSGIVDINGAHAPFNYVEPIDNVTDCIDAILADNNVTIVSINGEIGDACSEAGADFISPPDEIYNPCNPEKNITSCLQAKMLLENEIETLQQEDPIPDPSGSINLQNMTILNSLRSTERCLKKVNRILFELYLHEGLYQSARDIFNNDDSDDSKVSIFSTYIFENNLNQARQYLNNFTTTSEALEDFRSVQSIHLEYLGVGSFYEANGNQMGDLYEIAEKAHPYAAYAKAMIFLLTEEVLASKLPQKGRSRINSENNSPFESNGKLFKSTEVFPNPFTDNLNITLIGYDLLEIEIIDLSGRVVYSEKSDNSHLSIDSSRWEKGVYVVTIKNETEIVYQEKLILIR